MNDTTRSSHSSLAMLAHELREPLASILFAAQAVTGAACENAFHREMWGVVERQGNHLAGIIDQVLELGCGSHGRIVLRKDWCDLGGLIRAAAETVQPLMARHSHRLTISLPRERVTVLADGLRVQQVLINLLTNAAKYTHPGGRIELSLEVTAGVVIIEVRDNGTGIPADLLPRVFDLFRQGGQTHISGFAGLGIGLALVKSLVELHGGTVTAHSEGAGTGAAFVVRLPETNPRLCDGYVAATAPDLLLSDTPWTTSAMVDA